MKRPALAGSARKGLLLTVRRHLDPEAEQPHPRSHQPERAQGHRLRGGDRRQTAREGHEDPQPLQRPGGEEAHRVPLERVEPRVTSVAADTREQEAPQSRRPDRDQRADEQAARIHLPAQPEPAGHERQVRQAAGQVVVAFGSRQPGGHEGRPVDDEGEPRAQREHGNAADRDASPAARPGQACRERDTRQNRNEAPGHELLAGRAPGGQQPIRIRGDDLLQEPVRAGTGSGAAGTFRMGNASQAVRVVAPVREPVDDRVQTRLRNLRATRHHANIGTLGLTDHGDLEIRVELEDLVRHAKQPKPADAPLRVRGGVMDFRAQLDLVQGPSSAPSQKRTRMSIPPSSRSVYRSTAS